MALAGWLFCEGLVEKGLRDWEFGSSLVRIYSNASCA